MRIDPTTVRLLSDRVLLKRTPYENKFVKVVGITLNRGVVVAIGPGRRVKRMVRYRADGRLKEDLVLPDGPERSPSRVKPMRVRVGDEVEFSPSSPKLILEFEGTDGEAYVIVPELSVYGKTTGSRHDAILSQQSAGHERDGSYLAR